MSMARTAWNKGLTKETDIRVAQYTEKMRVSKTGVSVKHKKQFRKGQTPWNKGKKYTPELIKLMNLEGLNIGRGLFRGKIKKSTYPNIHYWVRTQKGTASICELCGHDGTKGSRCEWANKDHKYKHNLDDYVSMCKKCHYEHDKMLQ